MEKAELFKILLTKINYNNYKHLIDKDIFPEALHDLYESLEEAHKLTNEDIGCRDVWYVHTTRYPTLTEANKNVIKDILATINDAPELNEDIVEHTIQKSLLELKATKIAQAALEVAQGKAEDFTEIQHLLDAQVKGSDIVYVSTDVSELLDEMGNSHKYRFNLPELDSKVGPIGPGVFGVLAGPVNSGKSLLGINFVAGPKGFAEQGARCLYVGNEERRQLTMLRCMSCYTGLTRAEMVADPKKAQAIYDKIKDNVLLVKEGVRAFSELTYLINTVRPDIVVVDMLDKVSTTTSGRSERYLQLGDIYERTRELTDKYQCAILGLSQTNGDTFGQLTIDQNQLAGSRVDKAANADLVLTLGQLASSEDSPNFRQIYVAKSKLEGDKQKINCFIQPHLSRLVP